MDNKYFEKPDHEMAGAALHGRSLAARVIAGDEAAASRLISMIEDGDPAAYEGFPLLFSKSGSAHLVGITGPSGSGKSTIVGSLAGILSNAGHKVAVIAVDPSSEKSGGAILGDRLRMRTAGSDGSVFIRSMANRGNPGGICSTVRGVEYVLEALGKEVVIVESIGTGQSDKDIVLVSDTVITVFTPDYGDGLQLLKAGLLEIGDIVVMNKGDLPGAGQAFDMLSLFVKDRKGDGWDVPVIRAEGINGKGIDLLRDAMHRHKQHLAAGSRDRKEKDVQLALSIAKEEIWKHIQEKWANDPEVKGIITDIRKERMDLYSAVQRIVEFFNK